MMHHEAGSSATAGCLASCSATDDRDGATQYRLGRGVVSTSGSSSVHSWPTIRLFQPHARMSNSDHKPRCCYASALAPYCLRRVSPFWRALYWHPIFGQGSFPLNTSAHNRYIELTGCPGSNHFAFLRPPPFLLLLLSVVFVDCTV